MKKKVLFIDRDGTIIKEPADCQVDSLAKLEFTTGVVVNLWRIVTELDFELVMVTNQDGLGTEAFPRDDFSGPHNKMLNLLRNEGIEFKEVLIDESLPEEDKPTRKPGLGLVGKYLNGEFDIRGSYVIGDRLTDLQFAKSMGCSAIWFKDPGLGDSRILEREDLTAVCELTTDRWGKIYSYLKKKGFRGVTVDRETSETKINCRLILDGSGKSEVDTGLKFLDHMLEQLAFHSGFDLMLRVEGDLEVDEHHTMEDAALVLGEALLQVLGDKKGIRRYGFLLPMDDSVARIALDLSKRPWLNWQVKFKRDKVGDVPTEMFEHFFKSLTDAARFNLYIRAEGDNDHHLIESVFKGFGRSLKDAVVVEGRNIPSSKGLI